VIFTGWKWCLSHRPWSGLLWSCAEFSSPWQIGRR